MSDKRGGYSGGQPAGGVNLPQHLPSGTVRVTGPQQEAARLLTETLGGEVPEAVRKIADAPPQRGGYAAGELPVRELVDGGFGVALADEVRAARLPGDPLTPAEVRQLLRECVTVVAPGETLIIRAHDSWTATQLGEVQRVLNRIREDWDLPFWAIIVPGAELGVASSKHAVVHLCPPDSTEENGGVMPCCGKTPLEVAFWDRTTLDEAKATCKGDGA